MCESLLLLASAFMDASILCVSSASHQPWWQEPLAGPPNVSFRKVRHRPWHALHPLTFADQCLDVSAGELADRSPALPKASGNDSSDLLYLAPSSVVTISAVTHDGDCPPCGSPALLLGDAPASDYDQAFDCTPAVTPLPVLDDRAATAGWLLGRLSPIPGADLNSVCTVTASQIAALRIACAAMAALRLLQSAPACQVTKLWMHISPSQPSIKHGACLTPDITVPSAESEPSEPIDSPAHSNVGSDIRLLVSPSGILQLSDAVNTPNHLVSNKTAELSTR